MDNNSVTYSYYQLISHIKYEYFIITVSKNSYKSDQNIQFLARWVMISFKLIGRMETIIKQIHDSNVIWLSVNAKISIVMISTVMKIKLRPLLNSIPIQYANLIPTRQDRASILFII